MCQSEKQRTRPQKVPIRRRMHKIGSTEKLGGWHFKSERTAMSGNKAFGDLIRKRRQQKQKDDPTYSLRQFAGKVGLSPTFISKMETGEFDPPGVDKIKKIAKTLDLDPDELLNLAKKIDPELKEIVNEKKAMADFLRTASGLSEEKLRELTEQAKKMQREEDA